jgi:hypothetical protein
LLIEDVLSIAKAILNEYDRTNVLQLLQQTSAILAYRGTPNEQAYSSASQPLRSRAEAIINEEPVFLKSPRVKEFVERGMLEKLLPSDIANYVLLLLKPSLSLAGVSSEANEFQNRVSIARANLSNLIDVSTKLGIQPLTFPADKAVLLIVIPEKLIGRDAGQLGTIIKNVNEFISEVTELAGKREVPEFVYSGTSDFTFWQLITFENAVNVLQVVKSCYEAAKAYFEMRQSISDFKKSQIEKDAIDKYEKRESKAIVDSMEKQLTEVLNLAHQAEPGRSVELRSAVVNRCNYIAHQMESGLVITVEKSEETMVRLLSEASGYKDEEKISQLLQQNVELQQQIAMLLKQPVVRAISDQSEGELA